VDNAHPGTVDVADDPRPASPRHCFSPWPAN